MEKKYLPMIGLTLLLFIACTKQNADVAPALPIIPQLESVPPSVTAPALPVPPDSASAPSVIVPLGALSAEEQKDLLFIREEEKLARDVYLTLGTKYKLSVFTSIPESESRHMDAILTLLKNHLLPDPTVGKAVGEFSDPELQTLYTDLVKKAETAADALLVGGLIEEKDIQDIQKAYQRSTRTDVRTVFTNLMCGSRNHLRAFAVNYQKTSGAAYKAQILTQDEVDRILSSVDPGCN